MKKLLFAALLLVSFAADALSPTEWNARFGQLNPGVPINAKWSADGQKAYLMQLLQAKPTFYKNPDDYSHLVAPAPVAPHVPPVAANNNEFTTIINRIRYDLDLLEKLK